METIDGGGAGVRLSARGEELVGSGMTVISAHPGAAGTRVVEKPPRAGAPQAPRRSPVAASSCSQPRGLELRGLDVLGRGRIHFARLMKSKPRIAPRGFGPTQHFNPRRDYSSEFNLHSNGRGNVDYIALSPLEKRADV